MVFVPCMRYEAGERRRGNTATFGYAPKFVVWFTKRKNKNDSGLVYFCKIEYPQMDIICTV